MAASAIPTGSTRLASAALGSVLAGWLVGFLPFVIELTASEADTMRAGLWLWAAAFGAFVLDVLAIVLGAVAVARKQPGRGRGITAIVLGVLGLIGVVVLAAFGTLIVGFEALKAL